MTRIFHVSDIHFGREDRAALAGVEALVEERRPDGLIISGDLTQRGSEVEFEAAERWLSSLKTPYFTVPGNHDTPMFDLSARVKAPFGSYQSAFGSVSGYLDIGTLSIGGLNSARGWQFRRNWAEGVVDMEDLAGVLAHLESASGGISVLTCHHPFLAHENAPLKTSTRRGEAAARRLSGARTNLLLTGHVHMPSIEVFAAENGEGGYISVCAGTLSTRLRDFPPSMNELNFEAEQMDVLVHRFDSGVTRSESAGRWDISQLHPV